MDAWAYRVRWSEWHKKYTSSSVSTFPHHPFDKARNNPPSASMDVGNSIASFKTSVMRHVTQHVNRHRTSAAAHHESTLIRNLAQHSDVEITATDKTKKFAICNPGYIDTKRAEILNDPHTYRHEITDPTQDIQKQANSLWKQICNRRHLDNQALNSFQSFWSKPSELKVSLKDHKPSFPDCKARPLQPVQGQATEKLDWVASLILKQLLPFVPTHLSSSSGLRQRLHNIQPSLPESVFHFSLDVESLYPSCPTSYEDGINPVIEFLQQHRDRINMYNLEPHDVAEMLDFTFNNTLTRFEDQLYRQIKELQWDLTLVHLTQYLSSTTMNNSLLPTSKKNTYRFSGILKIIMF